MSERAAASTTEAYADEVVPDSLMDDFRGRPILTILVFTVVIHVVIVMVSSLPYLRIQVLGGDNSTLSEEERLGLAVKEATTSLGGIAKKYDVKPQDLSGRFASGAKAPTSTTPVKPVDPATGVKPTTPEEPGSAIEKKVNEKAVGPEQPELLPEEEDGLF